MQSTHILFGVVLLHALVNASDNATKGLTEKPQISTKPVISTPNIEEHVDIGKDTKSITVNKSDRKHEEKAAVVNVDKQGQDEEQTRQKRGYNFDGYPYPYPYPFPTAPSRGDGVYGLEDPLIHIHRRLSDIATAIRQPTLPPVPPATRYPLFIPFYVPNGFNCGCPQGQGNRPKPPLTPPKDNPPTRPSPVDKSNNTVPDIPVRGPEILEDSRRNWGIIVNEPETEDDEDFTRPISFDPIPPIKGMKRPPPPVEHGSVEGNINLIPVSTTPPPRSVIRDTILSSSNFEKPSLCDGAVLLCCHQPNLPYDCFTYQGCPNATLNGNPCESSIILQVVQKFQKYYERRRG